MAEQGTLAGKALLIAGSRELGIELAPARADACMAYLAELAKWNRKINLTAITGEREAIIKHLLDSFSYIKGLGPGQGKALLDMGSGAGFPGLALKIACPELAVTLVESNGKKASFLRHIVRTLGLDRVDVREARTSELPSSLERAYDIVTARAFADMAAALSEAARFLKPGGKLVLSRGPEETIGDAESEQAGFSRETVERFTLPYSDLKRALWTFRRRG